MTVAAPAHVSVETTNPKRPNNMGVQRIFTWDEIKEVVAAGRLELLGRTEPKEIAYRADMQKIREEYGSVTNYVLSVKLGKFINESTDDYLMIPNDYPYALPDNTFHYIVWSKVAMAPGTVPDPVVKSLFDSKLDELHGTAARESLWFVNPPALQSIPEVVHGHLIVKML
ncbi:hypothetical protein FBU59_005348 [Linderina macrospora]|uniref:Uncharacterized protein n=1 Tax=Linderina macrospora TaxID=4868 RepID=A0ACC1J2Y1_9FUNG|nr:hypothetical protein FBU59_005348 [Linderina macrospora]